LKEVSILLIKLDTTIDELIKNKKIKAKWSEIESYGITEMINLLWQDEIEYGSIGQATMVKDKAAYQNLFEGIPYKSERGYETIIRAYIDTDDNIVFQSSKGNVFLYETDEIDGEDLKYYNTGE